MRVGNLLLVDFSSCPELAEPPEPINGNPTSLPGLVPPDPLPMQIRHVINLHEVGAGEGSNRPEISIRGGIGARCAAGLAWAHASGSWVA